MTGTQQSSEFVIFVTHVESDDCYLKIWGQMDKNAATCVERMILPLAEQFARGQGCPGPQSNLSINTLCCARFQNDGYYRARIINVRPDRMVVLQFIDYGNIEILPLHEIHLLENISGSESLQSIPPVALNFTLMNVLPINGVWENNTIDFIKKTLWYNEYKVLFHSMVGNHRLIKLWYNNEDFGELLVKKHMAVAATLPEMFRPKCTEQSQVPLYQQIRTNKKMMSNDYIPIPLQNTALNSMQCQGNVSQGLWQNMSSPCIAQQKQMLQPVVQEALVFKSRVLDVGSRHDVYVSFVEDGPQKFSVQVQCTSQILSKLMRDINSHPTEPLHEPPLPGSVCLGRYTQDKVLCRAVVMSVMENKCKLYYVDFGHTEVLPYTDIFQLPPHYINPRVLSIRFTLSGVKELNVTDEMKEYFKKIVSGKLLVLHVRPPEGPPLIQYGDLYDNGNNIKDILRQAYPTPTVIPIMTTIAYEEPQKLLKGMEEIVRVSYVESCQKFFVQLNNGKESLDSIMICLAEYTKTAPMLNPTKLKVGLPCAAVYDSQWYRAQILDIAAEKIRVLYVDYGNEETVTLMSLREIHSDLVTNLRPQAIKCIWYEWETLPFDQDVANNKFEMLTLERCLHMNVVDVHSDSVVAELFGQGKENIKLQLLLMLNADQNLSMTSNSENPETNPEHCTKLINPKHIQRYNILHQKPGMKVQLNSIHQQKNKLKNPKVIREDASKWNRKDQLDPWQQTHNNGNTFQEKGRKIWKDEQSDEKEHDKRFEKGSFYRDGLRNDKGNKGGFVNNRFAKDRPYNKHDQNETNSFNRNNKESRGGRNKFVGTDIRQNRNSGSDKTWTDKDSDTSSRGSSKHGRGGNRGGGNRGGKRGVDLSGRIQSSRWNDRENRSAYKSGRVNGDFTASNNKFKDRRGQTSGASCSKASTINSWKADNKDVWSSKCEISPPNITVGAIKACEVVFANSPSDFFVQLSPDYLEWGPIMERMCETYESGGEALSEDELSIGTYCVAQYKEDLKWYRAVIKFVDESNVTVQFVDYGNTETYEKENLFNILSLYNPEFAKPPMQAIHCKLLGVPAFDHDANESKTFQDKTEGKTLEAEFVAENNGVYEILLREIIEGIPQTHYINEEICGEIDVTKAKDEAINRRKVKYTVSFDYVPFDSTWKITTYEPGSKENVIVTWFTNPNNFYCQTINKDNKFRTMMNEIQKVYIGREPVSHGLQVGSPVIAIFAEDEALYRAEVIELDELRGYVVQYVDFGNCAVVDPRKIYPAEKKLLELPKQAFHCSLKSVVPNTESTWSKVNTEAIDNCFNGDKYECTFHAVKGSKYIITLNDNGQDVTDTLVEKGLASYATDNTVLSTSKDNSNARSETSSDHVQRIDISLLNGQTLRVKISSVENATKFHIQLPSAAECENIINTYMADKNTEVMPRLSIREVCLGAGCLVYTNGMWRRAVVINSSQSTNFDVKLIDTGAYDQILLDCMLALPGELSVMQNQAIECCILNASSSFEEDQKLKGLLENKEVIIYVESIDNNRLIVKLYDVEGNAIVTSVGNEGSVPPVCSMPILNSTHKVLVSYADHSGSIWLQRYSDYNTDVELVRALEQRYTNSSGKELKELTENLLCVAKSADGRWYRGKIIKCSEKGAYVRFIDYGNVEEISSNALMILEKEFYLPHQLAINAALSITLNVTESEQLNMLHSYLSNKELTAVFYNVNKKWIVELFENGEKLSDRLRSINLEKEPASTESKVEDMSVGSKYDVSVSHVDSPSQFWLQRTDDIPVLTEKQAQLQAVVSSFPPMDGIPEEGTSCAAVYSIDNLWYRAEVLDADEDITTVRFVDYGNTDVIDNKRGSIRQMTDSWKAMKQHAIKCRLDIIPVDSEDWSESTCERFENLVTSVDTLQALLIANSVPKRVELFVNEKSVSETLTEEHHAVMIHTEEELIDEIVDLELDPHSAFVSHVNSPSEFWVQEEKSVADLEVMSDRFIVADMFPKIDEPKEGLLCVAKFPEDEQWYRARVVSHNDAGTQVIYIDYGNSAVSTEIRAIPEDLASIPPLSRKCCLASPEGIKEWSTEACGEFVKLAADGATIFLLDVLKEQESSVVKLTLKDKDVADLLANFCERQLPIIEERLPPLGEENSPNVVISHVNSPTEFWVQAESSIAELEVMSDRLQAASSFLPLTTLDPGTICAAKYPEDEQWYRAKILSHKDSGTEVLYIDYGNSAITTEIRMLPEDIVNIPVLSKRCSLSTSNHVSWTDEACNAFKELAADGATMFQFEILDNEDPLYVQLNLNSKNVIEVLLPLCDKNKINQGEDTDDKVLLESDNVKDNDSTADPQKTEDKNSKENGQNEQSYSSGSMKNTDFENEEDKQIVQPETYSKCDEDVQPNSPVQNLIQETEGKSEDTASMNDKIYHVTELSVDDIVGSMVKNAIDNPEIMDDKQVVDDDNEIRDITVPSKQDTNEQNIEIPQVAEKSVGENLHVEDDSKASINTETREHSETFSANPNSLDKTNKIEQIALENLESYSIVERRNSIPDTAKEEKGQINSQTFHTTNISESQLPAIKTDFVSECEPQKIEAKEDVGETVFTENSSVLESQDSPSPKPLVSEENSSVDITKACSKEEDKALTVFIEDNIPK